MEDNKDVERDKAKQCWVTGKEYVSKATLTQFEKECKRLGIGSEDTEKQYNNVELRVWVKVHKNRHFVPMSLLQRMRTVTLYDHPEKAPYTLTADCKVIAEPLSEMLLPEDVVAA